MKFLHGVVAAVVAAITVAVPSAAQADPGDGWFSFQNEKTGLFLGVNGGSNANGAKIIQYTGLLQDNDTQPVPDQDWLIVHRGAYVSLRNAGTADRKAMGVSGGSIEAGAKVIQWEYDESNLDQQWILNPIGNSRFELINRKSEMCLAIPGGTKVLGTQAIQWPCIGDYEQIWKRYDDNWRP